MRRSDVRFARLARRVRFSIGMLAALAATVLSVGAMAGAAATGAGSAGDAEAILKGILDNMRGGSVHATLSLSVLRPSGETRYGLEILGDGEQRALAPTPYGRVRLRAVRPGYAPGQRTVVTYERYRFGVDVSPACFTLQALESGCPAPAGSSAGERR